MKHTIIGGICLSLALGTLAQKPGNDPVILTVGPEKITKSQFERIYNKNNRENDFSEKALKEYMELFINYRLKVKEAFANHLDTIRTFQTELEGYRKQLAQPYLTDKEVTQHLMDEAFQRFHNDVHAAHILIKVSPEALPKDTMAAYKRIIDIRNRILKGEDFMTVSKEVSEDPSAKDNGGDLGYFTALQMVYPFESAAFNTKVGEMSMPVRTRYGYHLIKVLDKRNDPGQVKVEHIMVKANSESTPDELVQAEKKIQEIYTKVKAGEDFEQLARQFSDDVNSGRQGGALPMFGTGRMVSEFENAAFALKNIGDITVPIKTPFGWHIIKLIEKKPIGDFASMQADLKSKISRDSRSELSRKSVAERVKKEMKFKENKKALNEVLNTIDSTLTDGKWDSEKAKGLNKTLFTIGTKNYTQQEFVQYIAGQQSPKSGVNAKGVALKMYDSYVEDAAIAFEEANLEAKYPDFAALMQEYRDGILLFELTDREVWNKAVKDTNGLKSFYNTNASKYQWGKRVDAIVYSCANKEIAAKVKKLIANPKIGTDSLMRSINKNSQLNLRVREGKFSKKELDVVDQSTWEKGAVSEVEKDGQIHLVKIIDILPSQTKTLNEARGAITADFQQKLESDWIEGLRKKYPFQVDWSVFKTLVR